MKTSKLVALLVVSSLMLASPLEARPRKQGARVSHGAKVVHRAKAAPVVSYRPAVAYRPSTSYRPVVTHVSPAPVHVVRHHTVYSPAPVVHTGVVVAESSPQRAYDTGWRPGLAVGLRPSAILLDGEKLALSRFENPTLGGLGVVLRGDVSPSFSLELGFDYLVGARGDFRQRTMPLMLSGVFHFFPEARLNPYVLAGAGVHITELSYGNGAAIHELWEVAGQAGAGVRVKLTDALELFGDVRGLGVYKNLSDVRYGDCSYGACGADPNDRWNLGAQFSAGLAYRF
jgi:opacity protein-like surface antigen